MTLAMRMPNFASSHIAPSTPRRTVTTVACALALTAVACAGRGSLAPALAPLPFPADSVRTQIVSDGVVRRYIHSPTGPWAIHVLDVDLSRCNVARAVKGAPGAVGRVKTSESLRQLASSTQVIGGVNADFFSLTPPLGVPVGAFVSGGILITGPAPQAVLAIDSAKTPRIVTLSAAGRLTIGSRQIPVGNWNRAVRAGVAFFDAAWGLETDTASGVIEVVLARDSGDGDSGDVFRVVQVDTLAAGVSIPPRGGVIVAGVNASTETRQVLRELSAGSSARLRMSLAPFHPNEAVGGRPRIVRDSTIETAVDTLGQASFNVGRNPRTAAGIAANGRRLILAVVDGRQKPYSDGMSLRELAVLMLALGARDAINLDGGGSSALVYADPDSARTLRVANRPSDAGGERAVGDALAIVRACR